MAARTSCYQVIPHQVSVGDRDRLDSDFTKDELFAALCSMQNGKSPGMDGLPCEFYKAMWDTVGDDFRILASEAFSLGHFTESFNQGFLKQIPKNASRDSIGGWRPITLLRIAYKILPKAIALRIRNVARNIVRREQIGFVQGRFILDTVISAWEAMDGVG